MGGGEGGGKDERAKKRWTRFYTIKASVKRSIFGCDSPGLGNFAKIFSVFTSSHLTVSEIALLQFASSTKVIKR